MADEQKKPEPVDEPQQPETDAAPDTFDTPPKSTRSRKPRARKSSGTSSTASTPRPRKSSGTRRKKVDIGKGMTELYASVGVGMSVIPSKRNVGGQPSNMLVGMTIVENAQQVGDAWQKLADENPAVRDVLERVVQASAVGTLLTAHMPIMATAALAYGLVPDNMAALFAGMFMSPEQQQAAAQQQAQQQAAAQQQHEQRAAA